MPKKLADRMKPRGRLTWLAVLAAACLLLAAPAWGAVQDVSVLESRPVSGGLVLEKRLVSAGGGQVVVFVIRADLTNPYLKINTLVGTDGTLDKNARVTEMAVKAGAVAAVNADFFQMAESGRPIGMTYRDGQLVSSPPLREDMFGWAVTKGGAPLIELFSFSGKVTAPNGAQFPLAGVNKPSYLQSGEVNSHDHTLLLYNRHWGQTSRGKTDARDSVTEVFVNNGTVTEILNNQPGKDIPAGGFVLAGRGRAAEYIKKNLKVGAKITVDYRVTPEGESITAGTGGWSLLVDNGQAFSSFPASINGANARTALGYTRDKKTLLVVTVEKSSQSRGLTLNDLAGYMVSLGAYRALNLDGGGSTTLAVRPLGEEKPVLLNKPQKEPLRPVPTALAFFSTAPRGSLAGLMIKCPDQVFPGDSVAVTVNGYDSHYNPYPLAGEKVSLSLDSGPGKIQGGLLTAAAPGLVNISAGLSGVRAAKTVQVLGRGDLLRISADPASITVKPGGIANLKITATDGNGVVYVLSAKNYTVSLDPGLGRLENGVFSAPDTPVAGKIRFALGDYDVLVPVTVRPEDQAGYQYNPGQQGTLTLGGMTLSFTGKSFDSPVTVSARFGGELAGPLPGRYKSVSSVVLQPQADGPAALNDPALLNWKFPSGEGGRVAVVQLLDGAWREIPSRLDGKDNSVTCRIWQLAPLALVRDAQDPPRFSDLAGPWAWAAAPVSRLAAAGVVSGYPGNIYDPARKISRAEFLVLLGRTMGWQPLQGEINFKDAAGVPAWARGYLLAAVKRGIISGYAEDRTLRPSGQVTRAEMAAMTAKALALTAGVQTGPASVFADSGSIPRWAEDPVAAVFAAGIMKGDNENRFRPGDRATRAESAAMLDKALNHLLK